MNFRVVGTVTICTTPGRLAVNVFARARMSESPRSGSRVMFDDRLVDDAVDLREVPEAGLHGLVRERADEVLLTPDAAEVGGTVLRPLPVGTDVLVLARPRVRERLLAVESMAAGGLDRQARFTCPWPVSGSRWAPCRSRRRSSEAGEVDLQVVVDRDVEVLLDRLDDALRTAVERGVELRAAQARDCTHRSRGNDTSSPVWASGSMWAIMIVSERWPVCSAGSPKC